MNFENEAAAALAHEVKNPLSLIKMNVDFIKSQTADGFDDNFKIIEREIQKIDRLVTANTSKFKAVCIYALLEDIIREYDISLSDKKIIFKIEGDKNLYVTGDREKLNILFFNLIKNSVEAIDKKGEIKIKISENENTVLTQITDSGKGISADILDKLGQPYNTDKKGGSGLGLAICTSIVNEHKGEMRFENTENGCKVSVRLSK